MIKKFIIYFIISFFTIGIAALLLPVIAISFGIAGLVAGVVIFIALVLFVIFFIRKQVMASMKPKDIPNGIPAIATVVKSYQGNAKMTLGRVQEFYQLFIEVNVSDNYGNTWPAKMKEMIPITQIGIFQPGVSFNVKYDPLDKSKIVFDQTATAQQKARSVNVPGMGTVTSENVQSAMRSAPQDITLRLQAANALYQELSSSGVVATATVLRADLIHQDYMAGADVYQLKLAVNSTETPPFEAEVISLMIKQAIPKIQPGRTVSVCYDGHPQRLLMTGTDKPDTVVQL